MVVLQTDHGTCEQKHEHGKHNDQEGIHDGAVRIRGAACSPTERFRGRQPHRTRRMRRCLAASPLQPGLDRRGCYSLCVLRPDLLHHWRPQVHTRSGPRIRRSGTSALRPINPARASAKFLGEPDENSFWPPDVAQPIRILVSDHFTHEFRATLAEPAEGILNVLHREHDA
jgi:hypothetical protein